MKQLLVLALVAIISAQDTHYCPDGWGVVDVHDTIECILLGGLDEKVTKTDAELICGGHEGRLIDMDEESHGRKNQKIKEMIQDKVGNGGFGIPGPVLDDQWWIGATVYGPHDDHHYGNWTWDHDNSQVTWFDWLKDQPNNWHHEERCLTYIRDQDIFGYGAYHWNDWGCGYVARYICERGPLDFMDYE